MYKSFLLSGFAAAFLFLSCGNKKTNSESTVDKKANMSTDSISNNNMYLLVGTYTSGESKGIYVYQFDTISGTAEYKNMAEVENPSYLTISKDEKYVYAVTERRDDPVVSAFAFDKKDGSLKLLNTQPTKGADPCYVIVDDANKHVVTANYSGANLTVFPVQEDGVLEPASQVIDFIGKGADPDRQKQPHIHCVRFSPDEKFLFADDLGTDQVHKFNVDASLEGNFLEGGTPSGFKVKAASGPRHLDFHPNGKFAYLINELSGAVTVFSYDSIKGNLKEIQSIQADTLNAKGSGDIHVSPDGRFVYASNRLKGDGIAIFSVNPIDGKLTKVGYQQTGVHPRNFVITPNGKYLLAASRDNNIIQVFLVDKSTGLLKDTSKDIKLDKPVCLKFASYK